MEMMTKKQVEHLLEYMDFRIKELILESMGKNNTHIKHLSKQNKKRIIEILTAKNE